MLSAPRAISIWPVVTALLLLAAGPAAVLRADIFVLSGGGRIEGQWLNRTERPLKNYRIDTGSGVTLTLPAERVAQVIDERPEQAQYRRLVAASADTVDGHWKLAQWCNEQFLKKERTEHLSRILQLDPNHEGARRALGYSLVDGRWLTPEEWRKQQGYEYYRGRWRLPQEIQLLEERRKQELAVNRWAEKIEQWREDLEKPDKAQEAREALLAVRDPLAVGPLYELARREPNRAMRIFYAEVFQKIGSPEAIGVLVRATLEDPDIEVRVDCLDRLAKMQTPEVVKTYIETLGDANNVRVNRAATALAHLEAEEVIGPLIDALITTHETTVGNTGDALTATFMQPGSLGSGGGLSAGRKTETVRVQVPNEDVLAALVSLSHGVNFSFDQTAWHYWYNAQRQQQAMQSERFTSQGR